MPYNKSFFKKIKQVKQTIRFFNGKAVATGFFADKNTKDAQGVSLIEKAIMNNYGIGCPARPFATTTKEEHEREHGRNISKAIIKSILLAQPEVGLQTMQNEAQEFSGEFSQAIKDWDTPPNAPATIADKGFDDPLVRTGEMRDAPAGRIVDKKK